MQEKWIHINVVLADRPYRIKIKSDEEEIVRKAAKLINDKVKEYQQLFSSKDKQDFLAMIAIQNTVESLKVGTGGAENGTNLLVTQKIEELENLLENSLKS
jgi:cell division protein ZapA